MTTAADRPTFHLVLRPEPGVDATRALRRLLKAMLRSFGLKCISVEEVAAKNIFAENTESGR